ncbi:pro-sigmaK processing inhibitor BofA family protein [Saliterribacillus persicus]|uniref:Inhibitor of the pro-sigma K processing machinery n=1 Tax=Saliterribacillus persicus TaxID=930114 RepID=A0A368X9I0_9BACI|nr:pro-sigmaK processing inhibitor BofA family protein [Saliterribacillus persicus]RCW64602.1 inhibitor of the pro-sigma K processing machinery [Saliterribacillus persicus]
MSVWVISGFIVAIVLLLTVGVSKKGLSIIGSGFSKLAIGVLMLFFLNLFGAYFGIHIPINAFTAIIVGFLGLAGIVSLSALHLFILS